MIRKKPDPIEQAMETALRPGRFIKYDDALENLDSARKCFEKAGLGKEWVALLAAIRSEHSRKTGFMPGFEALVERGSLPKQQSVLDRARKRRSRRFRTS